MFKAYTNQHEYYLRSLRAPFLIAAILVLVPFSLLLLSPPPHPALTPRLSPAPPLAKIKKQTIILLLHPRIATNVH